MTKKIFQSFASPAFRFVMIMGIVNLFADMTYEGGAAINGPFLGILGASGAAISIIAGLGEFLGYSLRPIAGYISDKTGKYWLVTFIGYSINLLAVPAMALAGSWEVAAALIIAERVGRALRKPTVESMLSYATGRLGKGFVYAVNTALDETGATLGPLLMALVLLWKGNYKIAYGFLLISSVMAMIALSFARAAFPVPSRLDFGLSRQEQAKGFTPPYWLYMIAGALFASGLMSYELVSYHVATTGTVAEHWIPVMLAFATGCGVIANLVLGRCYDRFGLPIILIAVALSALFSPLVFLGGLVPALVAMPLWGIGYATQDTLLKAVVAGLLPENRRSLAFGLFYAGYGCGWLIGSIISGLLYQRSLFALVIFAVLAQLSSLPVFMIAARKSGVLVAKGTQH